ncbi:hypothetical protein [Pelomonas sp. SE-A7]|uniref:hypothetical protein n=1 Tax=Pelomonas sp. SE-A7 TaxID=3054953 RepID=UPI00259C737B|nr:hypothetical protein [Pelomonas sp. SE-A7]MDM4768343.1 hypothetical protein [Pelomonas sp. SE-A7]
MPSPVRLHRPFFILALLAVCTACGGGGGGGSGAAAPATSTPQPAVPATPNADITVLMMGNSHTTVQGLNMQLEQLLRNGSGGKTVALTVASGFMYLDERLADAGSMALLRSRSWSVVVLQAQKYSTSGQFFYSTAEAEELVRIARTAGSLPVMFPEWPREGVDETARIYDLHVSIAQKQPACVAPIGQAWELSLQRHPELRLHSEDGNHSAPAGAFLAAVMLYATISGTQPAQLLALPDLANGVDAASQAKLRQVAADTALAYPPRRYCPA